MTNKQSKVLVSDFDGTISTEDFFWYAIEKLLTPADIKPWQDYEAGKIVHVEALRRIFAKIHIEKEKFHKFILKLYIEECFVDTAKYCHDKNIPFYIVSAGADYYIKIILKELCVDKLVTLVSNKSIYSEKGGLEILPSDKNHPYYSTEYGINKMLVVKSLKEKYDTVIYAGDGTPDFEAAKLADVVFARGKLLRLCQKYNIKARELKTYCEILEYLKNG